MSRFIEVLDLLPPLLEFGPSACTMDCIMIERLVQRKIRRRKTQVCHCLLACGITNQDEPARKTRSDRLAAREQAVEAFGHAFASPISSSPSTACPDAARQSITVVRPWVATCRFWHPGKQWHATDIVRHRQ